MYVWAVLVSTSFPVGKAITHALDPLVLTFLRFVLASLLFGGLVLATGGTRRPGPRDLLRYSAVALSMVVYFVLMFEALRTTDPVSTGALFTLVPLLSGVVGAVLLGEGMSRKRVAILSLGAAGAAWVVFDGSIDALRALRLDRGEKTFLVGTLSFAFYAPLIKRLHRGERAVVMAFWTVVAGAVLLGVVAAPRILATDWGAVPTKAFVGVAYLAALPTAVTFGIVQYASVRLPPSSTMAYTYLVPAFVTILHGLTTGAWPIPSVWVGVGIVAMVTPLLRRSTA
jgi:drug/metabolite transporter (DMT)-like permease